MDKRYLAARVRAIAVAAAVAGGALLTLALVLPLTLGRRGWPLGAGGACLLAVAGALYGGVLIPCRQREQDVRRLLRGYAKEGRDIIPVGPSDEMLFGRVQALLDPSQLFRLNKRQAQYLALQNQINPHFLYNTLESIRSEAMMAGLDSVSDMTEALANFFRYTISKVENLVSVEEELQNCETYFHIQQYRFGDRLRLNIECDPEDREELCRCRLPKLTLQPILENSIIHGTELKVGVGHLTIYAAHGQAPAHQRIGRRRGHG